MFTTQKCDSTNPIPELTESADFQAFDASEIAELDVSNIPSFDESELAALQDEESH